MPILGLGLSMDHQIGSLTASGETSKYSTMLLDTTLANGVVPGVNAPFTNPIVDLANEVGKNLANPSLQYLFNVNNTYIATPDFNTKPSYKLTKESTYTLSFYKRPNDGGARIFEGGVFKRVVQFIAKDTQIVLSGEEDGLSFYAGNFGVSPFETLTIPTTQVQLELGSTATAYEPYTRNDALWVNAAETIADGYDEVIAPNGKTVTMAKGGGIDTYFTLPNSADLDPTGLDNFGMARVFKTPPVLQNSYLRCKNLDSTATVQYAVAYLSNGDLQVRLEGLTFNVGIGAIAPNSFYKMITKRADGRLVVKLNDVEIYNQLNATTLTSRPNVREFARSNSADGLNNSIFYNGWSGLNSFTLNPTEQWENSFNQLANQIYGL